ncbi:Flagellar hook-associated protein FlgK [hydrothermal vent metagenome]|uniref:Flagellar hook-associated protein FlgK n=1 Tax=hydrothermal vent metagenome TaxID=652676 RepID=A0A3B1ATZ1_9ZZZZ
MGTGDVLGISTSGALAAQRALSTTSHNIANGATKGYSRQRTDLVARTPQPGGNGAVGTGVIVDNVRRVYDSFVTEELRNVASVSKALNTQYDYTSQVDTLLSDPDAGLAPTIQNFFAAMNGVADDPSSISARQVLLSEAHSLEDRFKYLDDRFESLRRGVQKDMRNTVQDINNLAQAIADVNEAIVRAKEVGGTEPNDLLDQRERLLLQLSEKISVRGQIQDDGRLNVFIGNGQTLVVGGMAAKMGVIASPDDASEVEVIFKTQAAEAIITKFLSGGELGGMLEFKTGILDVSQNDLGRIAIGISKTFNEQHHLGMDLKNVLGGTFFEELNVTAPQVKQSINNKGDIKISAEITNLDKVTVSDYRLSFHDGKYRLIRLMDDKLVAEFSSFPVEINDEGFKLSIESGSSIENQDSFIIRPTLEAGQRFKVLINDVKKIAAASPVRAFENVANLGDGAITNVEVLSTDSELFQGNNNDLEMPLVVRFVDETHYEILDNKGNPIIHKLAAVPDDPHIKANEEGHATAVSPESPASAPQVTSIHEYDPEKGISVFPTPDGVDMKVRFKITGNPKDGDTFHIEFNKDGLGDNSNAVSLAGLQGERLLADKTGTYTQIYAQLVSRVGSKTHELDTSSKAQQLLLQQADQRRESISGVNMDEEAANLIRYQQLYKANAQVIATAKELFDTLMQTFR